jgi:peptidyl-prolyl cis-trans isomerase B (cyclophilin B)
MKKLTIFLCVLALGVNIAQAQSNPANPHVTLHTSMGDIRIELYKDHAPGTVENFLLYAQDGFFDGTIFHRVISHFMIQGGGFEMPEGATTMQRKPTRQQIQNEATNGLTNDRGTIAMARTTDPHSATAQFFINVEHNANLNHTGTTSSEAWGYAVFGKVVSGMDVVDNIRFVQTGSRDVPLETVTIISAEIH